MTRVARLGTLGISVGINVAPGTHARYRIGPGVRAPVTLPAIPHFPSGILYGLTVEFRGQRGPEAVGMNIHKHRIRGLGPFLEVAASRKKNGRRGEDAQSGVKCSLHSLFSIPH